jgi:hypothetical protein
MEEVDAEQWLAQCGLGSDPVLLPVLRSHLVETVGDLLFLLAPEENDQTALVRLGFSPAQAAHLADHTRSLAQTARAAALEADVEAWLVGGARGAEEEQALRGSTLPLLRSNLVETVGDLLFLAPDEAGLAALGIDGAQAAKLAARLPAGGAATVTQPTEQAEQSTAEEPPAAATTVKEPEPEPEPEREPVPEPEPVLESEPPAEEEKTEVGASSSATEDVGLDLSAEAAPEEAESAAPEEVSGPEEVEQRHQEEDGQQQQGPEEPEGPDEAPAPAPAPLRKPAVVSQPRSSERRPAKTKKKDAGKPKRGPSVGGGGPSITERLHAQVLKKNTLPPGRNEPRTKAEMMMMMSPRKPKRCNVRPPSVADKPLRRDDHDHNSSAEGGGVIRPFSPRVELSLQQKVLEKLEREQARREEAEWRAEQKRRQEEEKERERLELRASYKWELTDPSRPAPSSVGGVGRRRAGGAPQLKPGALMSPGSERLVGVAVDDGGLGFIERQEVDREKRSQRTRAQKEAAVRATEEGLTFQPVRAAPQLCPQPYPYPCLAAGCLTARAGGSAYGCGWR